MKIGAWISRVPKFLMAVVARMLMDVFGETGRGYEPYTKLAKQLYLCITRKPRMQSGAGITWSLQFFGGVADSNGSSEVRG